MSSPSLDSALATLRSGDRAGAARQLRQLLSEQPDLLNAWLWLSAASDDPDEKRAALLQAQRLQPDHALAAQALTRLNAAAAGAEPTLDDILGQPASAKPRGLLPFGISPRLYVSVLILLLTLTILVAGLLVVLLFGSCGSRTPAQTYRVEYVLTGSAKNVQVTYNDGGGNYSQENATLPWRKTFTMQEDDLPTLSALHTDEAGSLNCQILLDEQPWQTAHSDVPYGNVTCSGMIGEP